MLFICIPTFPFQDWLSDNKLYWRIVDNVKSKDNAFFCHPHLTSIYFLPHISSKKLYFRLPPHLDGIQNYQFSYCSLVNESRLTVWIFTSLCHHSGHINREDPEIVEKSDGGLTRRADGCGLRATEEITHIRTEWNSQPDTFKESPNPAGDKMKPAEPDNASELSSSQKIWPGVASVSWPEDCPAIKWTRNISWRSKEWGVTLHSNSSLPR